MQKKVLLAKDLNQNTVGILSLECDTKLKGKLKLFDETKGTLVLKIGENILAFDKQNSEFEFETIFHDLNLPTACIICDDKILVTAKTENFVGDFDDILDEFKKLKNQENQTKFFNEESKELNNNDFNQNLGNFEDVKNNVKKLEKNLKNSENFEKNQKNASKNLKSLSENIDETYNFFDEIHEQFDELFNSNKPFLELEEKIENSKWVKVYAKSDFSNHYILGKIFDDEKLKFICYGIPTESEDVLLDDDLKPYAQWFPFEIDGVKGSGYFLTYQDAKTGENVLIN